MSIFRAFSARFRRISQNHFRQSFGHITPGPVLALGPSDEYDYCHETDKLYVTRVLRMQGCTLHGVAPAKRWISLAMTR